MGETPQYPDRPAHGSGPQPGQQRLWQPQPGAHQAPTHHPSGGAPAPAHGSARPSRRGLIAGITGVGALAVGLLVGWLVLPHPGGTSDLPDPESAAPGEYDIAVGCEMVRTLDGEFAPGDEIRLTDPSFWRASAAGQIFSGGDLAYPSYAEFAEPGRNLMAGIQRIDLDPVIQGVTDSIALCDERGL
ncbi:MAG: hypothetical protein ACTH0C_00440 [Actinomycetaceae bacterium]